jgi:hypothetical protein
MTNTPVQPQIAQPVYVKAPSNGLATAALVLGIIGTVISFIPLVGAVGAFIGGVGIALAIAGFLVAGKRGVGKGKSIAGFILGVASIIIFFAVTAATVAAVDTAIDEIDKSIKEEEKNDTPTAVAVGKPFEHDGYEFSGAWKVKNEFGSATIEGLKAKNTHDSREVIQLTFTFVKGDEKVGEVECSAGELEPGHSAAMDCFSLDSGFPKGYTEVQVADMW